MPLTWEQTEQVWQAYKDGQMENRFGENWYDRLQEGDENVKQGFYELLKNFREEHPGF